MAVPRLTSRVVVAALAATFVMGGALPAIAVGEGDTADGYPSWDEVNAARASESAKAAELEKLQAALQRAQSESAAASTRAVQALLDSHQAEQSLAAAREREQQLSERLDADRRELEENSDTVARVVAWMYRDGTGLASTSQLILSDDPGDFMAKYGTATQVSGTWEALAARAAEAVNAESDLEKQAATAREERQRLAAEARTAAEAAAEAQRAADAAVETASDNADTVTAQLASLRGTTAEVERQYQVGLQVAEQERAADAERQRQAEEARQRQQESGSGGGNIGVGGVDVDPAAAQAIAAGMLPAYGWGNDQFSCLVSLWNGESGWRADALNPWSGAYGIPQSLPAEKMAAAGPDWRTNAATQISWGLAYISAAYGSPCNAWAMWQSRNPHWY